MLPAEGVLLVGKRVTLSSQGEVIIGWEKGYSFQSRGSIIGREKGYSFQSRGSMTALGRAGQWVLACSCVRMHAPKWLCCMLHEGGCMLHAFCTGADACRMYAARGWMHPRIRGCMDGCVRRRMRDAACGASCATVS
eukprot:356668-Chlamydomonas_euryale.AAC.4